MISNDENFEADKKKILDDQEKNLQKDKESSEPLPLSDDLKADGIEMISYSKRYIYIETRSGMSLHFDLFKENLSGTLEYLDKLVDGTFTDSLKKSIILFITKFWDEKIGINKTKNAKGTYGDENDNNQNKQKSKSEIVIPNIKPHINQLFTDEYNVPHAGIKIDNHTEVLPIDSKRFRNWMARKLYIENNIVVDSSTLKDIIGILSAQAEFESPSVRLSLRVANVDGIWYYDLANKDWEFIKITADGYCRISNSIIFRRYIADFQVNPSNEYSSDVFDKFIDLININDPAADEDKNKESRLLLKCYIISLFIPDVPKVILMLHGEQGSAKTTCGELIRALVYLIFLLVIQNTYLIYIVLLV